MTATSQTDPPVERASEATRWSQLVIGIICMVMIANLQYGWTLFTIPISQKFGWSLASIQVAFTLFVLFETWLVPAEGYLVDRFGPRIVVFAGGWLTGLAWVLNSFATSLWMLYIAQIIGGLGAGAVYGTCIGNALKWFPDRRGLAAGLTAAGFGIGSALTIIPIQRMISTHGYENTFLTFGIGQGVIVVVLSLLLFAPRRGQAPEASRLVQQGRLQYQPLQVLREPTFWVMYLMFMLMAAGGLMATAQLKPIAKDFHLDTTPVALIGITLPALTFALTIDRVLNGLTRPFFGWVSDFLGRENTMFIAFLLEGIGIWALYVYGQNPLGFVLLSGVVFFAWGEIYSLFPASCTDCFGVKYATTNAGLLYTAKGTASLLVPLANVLVVETGGWKGAFIIASLFNIIAALMAIFVLKPMRHKLLTRSSEEQAWVEGTQPT
ncbi:oxalate/formate MFS antiporter [Bradyrhizobium sp. ISRA443]|uniref:oxalate/formate MFS antiporter n=1 Tax=unclassified Bradyrhizobium TaxID=2631580 RepID=UPI00247A7EAA|nr:MULTISPECIES: oxalate/formate MFS antiporter [unclassified Bradyrhizobium]WGR91134.1 oxalate/formate MFS antiporter [Bradyrhizobium sp. ISRA435]WGS01308.1 oxalate/formate MFS antiporter [Bradyrhizobium sp. ISRA436]WGS08195.1 oxalate/formate MFS antiporter [Bradyrhizobium sp. ISRA437]WGS15083.1 oxalate/formate MFS antiporter [Bradyrhizobium sp. ISRA443]